MDAPEEPAIEISWPLLPASTEAVEEMYAQESEGLGARSYKRLMGSRILNCVVQGLPHVITVGVFSVERVSGTSVWALVASRRCKPETARPPSFTMGQVTRVMQDRERDPFVLAELEEGLTIQTVPVIPPGSNWMDSGGRASTRMQGMAFGFEPALVALDRDGNPSEALPDEWLRSWIHRDPAATQRLQELRVIWLAVGNTVRRSWQGL